MRANGRRLLGCLAILTIVLGLLPLGLGAAVPGALPRAFAEEQGDMPPVAPEDVVDQGTCGESVEWSLDRFGVLRITGEGAVSFEGTTAPWNVSHEDDIRFVIVGEDVGDFPDFSLALPNCKAIFFTGPYRYDAHFAEHTFDGFSGTCYGSIDDSTWSSISQFGDVVFRRYLPGMTTQDWSVVEDIGLLYTNPDAWPWNNFDAFWTYGQGILSINGEGSVCYPFSESNDWDVYRESTVEIRVSEGITELNKSELFASYPALVSVSLPSTLESVSSGLFRDCLSLEHIELPESVVSIYDGAFQGCTALKTVTFPKSLKTIYSDAFSGCTSLESAGLPEGLETIYQRAFSGCTSLKIVTFPESLTSIGDDAFSGCTSLESVELPEGLEAINSGAFSGCTSLESVTLPESLTTIYYETFSDCTSLKTVKFPESLTGIGESAFSGCTSLESVRFPGSLSTIGSQAFSDCTSLSRIDFLGALPAIYFGAFENVRATATHLSNADGWATFDKTEDFEGVLKWFSVSEDGTLVEDPFYPPSRYRVYDLSMSTWEKQGSYPDGYVAWHLSLPKSQVVDLSYFLDYEEDCKDYSASLVLMRAKGNAGLEIWRDWASSNTDFPDYAASGKVVEDSVALEAGEYYLLADLYNSHDDTFFQSLSVRFDPTGVPLPESGSGIPMYRLYNRWTGEHFYTSSSSERDSLKSVGWAYEGVGWTAPAAGAKVYRLYNPYVPGGDHHYTLSEAERDSLISAGWRYEGVGWRSASDSMGNPEPDAVALYRQYNPYATTGTHNYTASRDEVNNLVSVGWRAEGVAWYGI